MFAWPTSDAITYGTTEAVIASELCEVNVTNKPPLIQRIQQFIGLPSAKERTKEKGRKHKRPPAYRTVYTEENYKQQYIGDLNNSESQVIIANPYATQRGVNYLSGPLSGAVRRGVRVCCFLQEPQDWELRRHEHLSSAARAELNRFEMVIGMLTDIGVHVNLRPRDHFKLTIIDGRQLWDGSLNYLSHYETKERLTRWESQLEVVAATNLHALSCPTCITGGLMMPSNQNPQEFVTHLGEKISHQRRLLGLTQEQLSNMTQINTSVLSRIESGTGNPGLTNLFTICQALGLDILLLERHTVPAILQRIKSKTN